MRTAVRVGALVVIAASLVSCAGERVEPSEIVRASVAGPESREVKVVFYTSGSADCRQFDAADVREDGEAVTVRVTVKTSARDCPDDGQEAERTVRLSRPLDARELIDGSTGQPVAVERS